MKPLERLKDIQLIISDSGAAASRHDPRLKRDYIRSNVNYCIAAGIQLCILGLIGAVGTHALWGRGIILPQLSATMVYILLFLVNAVFLFLFSRQLTRTSETEGRRKKWTMDFFMAGNMILASLTFFTTEEHSSFFFEYILVTSIIYLVPMTNAVTNLRNSVINIVTASIILQALHHALAWQDLVDFIALHILCSFINRIRWQAFLSSESAKFEIVDNEKKFYSKSRTDELTGLLNRTALREDFADLLDKSLFVALLDLDSFKKANDIYGHAYGDRILVRVGSLLRKTFQNADDRCYRYGGDELLVISAVPDGEQFSRRLREFQTTCETAKDDVSFSVSIGYCRGTAHSEQELRAMIRMADSFLYEAKGEGGGKIKGSASLTGHKAPHWIPTQTPVLDTLKDVNEAVKLFDQNDMSGKAWSIAYFDVNGFSEITEELGYWAGQNLLESISQFILNIVPDGVLIHSESAHFVLFSILPDEEFGQSVRRIQGEVGRAERRHRIILRAGVFHHHTNDAPSDFAAGMYNAKYAADADPDISHRDSYFHVYDAAMSQEKNREIFVHNQFETALQRGYFIPYYQPIVGGLSGTTCGLEALSRWQDPEQGLIPPGDFIPYLERTNEVYRLDLYILEQVCRDVATHREYFPEKIFINVNLSQTDFRDANMPEEIEHIMSRYQISRQQIQFEITESAFADSALLQDSLRQMHDLGYRLWIDDFGVGESSLSSFGSYRVQGCKLDQSFLADYANHRTQTIVRSVVDLSHETNCMIIAEGVENWDQLWLARQWGINFIQGYYFSRPLPLEKLLESHFLRNRTDACIDLFYQTAAEVNLGIAGRQLYLPGDGAAYRFCRAVLQWDVEKRQLSIVRMNDEMQQNLKDYYIIREPEIYLKENSALAVSLLRILTEKKEERAEQGPEAKKNRGPETESHRRDGAEETAAPAGWSFDVVINGKKFRGLLSYLIQNEENGNRLYVLNLTNFAISLLEQDG
ncbi:MAG: bifunctional diguanylate cyclase/phosphodiesterase [Lachnospiraceae bacterium]|nr:bifunctional diguanylate cyclase/phosphodiesterase [Lachnospiraceae bacterium]